MLHLKKDTMTREGKLSEQKQSTHTLQRKA